MRAWIGLAVLALPCLLVSLDAEVLNLAAPALAADLRPTGVQQLWIMDSYVFVVAGALIAMGVLGDRIGRRRLLLAGAAAFGVSSLLAAFAATPAQLIAARVLMGLAGASLMPSTLALISVMFPDARRRTVALGIWSASFSLGGIASPLIGGALLAHFWWGSVFLVAVPVVALLLALGPFLLPESRDGAATRFDLPGALLSLSAVLLLVYGVKRLAASGWSLPSTAAVLLSLLLGAAFLTRQRRITFPLLDLTLFRDRRLTVALAANALSFFVQYGSLLATAQYLQVVLGLSPMRAGLWTLPSVIAYLAASFLGPALAHRFPRGRVIALGLAAMAAGFAVLAAMAADPSMPAAVATFPAAAFGDLPVLVVGTCLIASGLAPVYILTTELVVSTAVAAPSSPAGEPHPSRAGMAAAVTETSAELFGALGIAILGSLVVAVYRHGTADLPLPAGGTLPDAASTAGSLPPAAASDLMAHANAAYSTAFTVMSLTAAALLAATAMLAAKVLHARPARPADAASSADRTSAGAPFPDAAAVSRAR
ncbi:MFS transporter [Actinoplanes sp. CA-030573]|uniref:MFS transporter n=1 Tax=Actinoplanes sp. CA-030573 TaxID=3239898 RepID=UPI003D93B5EB